MKRPEKTIKVTVEFEFPESYEAYFSRESDMIEAIICDNNHDFKFKIINQKKAIEKAL